MIETNMDSQYGPPAFEAALLKGIKSRLHSAGGAAPEHFAAVLATTEPHFSGVAAVKLANRRGGPRKPGMPPLAPPKLPIAVFCGASNQFVAATKDALREYGANYGVVFSPEFAGIGKAPAGYEDSWFRGVDGTNNTTPSNIRSWKNRINTVDLMLITTEQVQLIEHFLRAGGAAVIEIADPAAVLAALRRFSHYKVVNSGGIVYAVCVGCRLPGAVGTRAYDELVDAVLVAAR